MISLSSGPHLIIAVMRGPDQIWSWGPQYLLPAFWAGGFDPAS